MKEQVVSFQSAGLRLHGVIGLPETVRAGERRAAFLVLHGFGSNSESSNVVQPTRVLNEFGYVTLRFDMRGCGKSEGEFGRVICLEQVEDLNNALAFLATNPAVDPARIGAIGSSFGGAVAVYAGGTNPRFAAVISNGGWGHGERKFRGQHRTAGAWAKFTRMLDKGRAHRARTGQSLMVPATTSCRYPTTSAIIWSGKRSECWRRIPLKCFPRKRRRACSISALRAWSGKSRRGRCC